MGITELAEIARRRCDAEEEWARRITDGGTGEWFYREDHDGSHTLRDSQDRVIVTGFGPTVDPEQVGLYLTGYAPQVVLAQVAAKRQLLDEVLGWPHGLVRWGHNEVRACDSVIGKPCDCGRDARVLAVLQHLATPYQETP